MKKQNEQKEVKLKDHITVSWLKSRCGLNVKTVSILNDKKIKEQQMMKKIFHSIDKDNSNALDREELYYMFRRYGFNITRKDLNIFFGQIDQNNDCNYDMQKQQQQQEALNWQEFMSAINNEEASQTFINIMRKVREECEEIGTPQTFLPMSFYKMIQYLNYRSLRDQLINEMEVFICYTFYQTEDRGTNFKLQKCIELIQLGRECYNLDSQIEKKQKQKIQNFSDTEIEESKEDRIKNQDKLVQGRKKQNFLQKLEREVIKRYIIKILQIYFISNYLLLDQALKKKFRQVNVEQIKEDLPKIDIINQKIKKAKDIYKLNFDELEKPQNVNLNYSQLFEKNPYKIPSHYENIMKQNFREKKKSNLRNQSSSQRKRESSPEDHVPKRVMVKMSGKMLFGMQNRSLQKLNSSPLDRKRKEQLNMLKTDRSFKVKYQYSYYYTLQIAKSPRKLKKMYDINEYKVLIPQNDTSLQNLERLEVIQSIKGQNSLLIEETQPFKKYSEKSFEEIKI